MLVFLTFLNSGLEFDRRAWNQAVAPGITRDPPYPDYFERQKTTYTWSSVCQQIY